MNTTPASRLPWHPPYLHLRVEVEEGMVSIPTRVHNRIILAEVYPRCVTKVASASRENWGHETLILDHVRGAWASETVDWLPSLPLGPATPGVRSASAHPSWVLPSSVRWTQIVDRRVEW